LTLPFDSQSLVILILSILSGQAETWSRQVGLPTAYFQLCPTHLD